MKNIKNFNPIVLARNALAASGLMTLLNIIVVALHFSPIFPLSLMVPVNAAHFVFKYPEAVVDFFESYEQYQLAIPFFTFVMVILLLLLAYSYLKVRRNQEPSRLDLGF